MASLLLKGTVGTTGIKLVSDVRVPSNLSNQGYSAGQEVHDPILRAPPGTESLYVQICGSGHGAWLRKLWQRKMSVSFNLLGFLIHSSPFQIEKDKIKY